MGRVPDGGIKIVLEAHIQRQGFIQEQAVTRARVTVEMTLGGREHQQVQAHAALKVKFPAGIYKNLLEPI